MSELGKTSSKKRLGIWSSILLYGVLLFAIYGISAFLIEQYSGGCMFIIPAYFYALVTVLAILSLQRFGVGAAVFLPIATLGGLMEYYIEWVANPALRSPWLALGWSLVFLGIGFSADLVYRFSPSGWHPRWRAILMGAVFGLTMYLLYRLGLSVFYPYAPDQGHLRYFVSGIYFSLPWMLVNGAFAGYTAHAISLRV
jgi:hypothetical protein